MVTSNDITYTKFGLDPIGRVFFCNNRVFRGIYAAYKNETMEFMSSKLFGILQEYHYIPRTWIAQDVNIPEYALILEHENCYISPFPDWSFEMYKSAMVFTLRLEELCEKYGYYLKDEHQGNISFLNGRPIMIDFGSFEKGERPADWGKQFAEKQYLILSMFSHGETQIVHYLNLMSMSLPLWFPEKSPYQIKSLRPYYHGMVKYYDVYLRKKWNFFHLRVYTLWMLNVIDVFNSVFRKLGRKAYDWNLFKIDVKIKKITIEEIEKIKSPFTNTQPCFPIQKKNIDLEQLILQMSDDNSISRLLLVGNHAFETVNKIANESNVSQILVMSNDNVYLDMLFKYIQKAGINTFPVNWCLPHIPLRYDKQISHLAADLVIVSEVQDIWLHPAQMNQTVTLSFPPSLIAQALSMYCRNLLLIQVIDNEIIEALRKYFIDIKQIKINEDNYILFRKIK